MESLWLLFESTLGDNKEYESRFVVPGLEPRIVDIPHTLSDMQALVGGMIEIVEPFDDPDIVLVCDECGRNGNKPVNRMINREMDVCGNFFICGHDGENLCSIPEPMAFKYASMFRLKA